MFKKGMKPHNKGDSYVDGNYRNKPKKDKDDMMYGNDNSDISKMIGYDPKSYNEKLYKKFFGHLSGY